MKLPQHENTAENFILKNEARFFINYFHSQNHPMNSSKKTMADQNLKNVKNKPHVLCLPFPAQGHINPMLRLAVLLHSRGFHITFVNTEYNHRRLLKSRGRDSVSGEEFPGFELRTISDGLPPPPAAAEDGGALQDVPSLCESIDKNWVAPLVELIRELDDGGERRPPVSCVICDAIMCVGVAAAREVGIPSVVFRTTSAVSYFANRNLPELMKKGIIPVKDISNGELEFTLDWIPPLKKVRLKDLPSYIRIATPDDEFMLNFIIEQAKQATKASAMIYNTFDDLEDDVLTSLSPICPPIHTIGPLHLLIKQLPENNILRSFSGSLWKEDLESVDWLNSRAPNSVVYVNFGSIAVMTPRQLVEFARGLADSERDFLWIIRSDSVKGESNDAEYLTLDFLEETKERGLIVKWCPQEKVLDHPSVGAFLTHCGWNSMMESITSGVPMICWPFFADQQINCRFACAEWAVGLEIDTDVDRVEVAKLVKELIGGEMGKKMKSKAMRWKNKAIEAITSPNGSSCSNFENLVKQLML